jgi:uncharacterized protein YbaP (TraB family)
MIRALRPVWPIVALLCCSALWLPACGGTTTISSPLLWEVSGNGVQAYLFGTMHVADPRVTNLHPAMEAAFESVDAFYTEAGESGPEDSAKMASAAMLPEGMSLRKLLPPNLWQDLDDYLQLRKFGTAQDMDRYRPWYVALQLAQIDAIPLLEGGQALDFALTARAKAEHKEIGAVEHIEEQLAALTVGSLQDQIHMLDITLQNLRKELAAGQSSVEQLLELYVSGDTTALWDFAMQETDLSDPVQQRAWDALTTIRNRTMVERIHEKLQAAPEKKFMFAFGSLHFVGPDSVVEGLRALGYQVTRVQP